MSVDNEPGWDELARDWTVPARVAGVVSLPTRDEVRRRARLQSWMFAGEMVFGLVVLALLAWRTAAGDPLPVMLAGIAFTLLALLLSLWAWRLRPVADTATVRDALEDAIGQARAWVRWALAGYAICAAAGIYLLLIVPYVAAIGFVLFGIAYVLAALGVIAWVHRRQRRRIAGLVAMRRELADEA